MQAGQLPPSEFASREARELCLSDWQPSCLQKLLDSRQGGSCVRPHGFYVQYKMKGIDHES
jgi:hypothetical protein